MSVRIPDGPVISLAPSFVQSTADISESVQSDIFLEDERRRFLWRNQDNIARGLSALAFR